MNLYSSVANYLTSDDKKENSLFASDDEGIKKGNVFKQSTRSVQRSAVYPINCWRRIFFVVSLIRQYFFPLKLLCSRHVVNHGLGGKCGYIFCVKSNILQSQMSLYAYNKERSTQYQNVFKEANSLSLISTLCTHRDWQ